MKKFAAIFLFLAAFIPAQANAANNRYIIDPAHTNVIWSASHYGFSNVYGRLNNVRGTIFFDKTNPALSSVDVVMKSNSLDTSVPKLTQHLKSEDFFNAEQFPDIIFKSTNIKTTSRTSAVINGNLTILGVTKPAALRVIFNKAEPSPLTKKRVIGFSADTSIKRSDFGMNYGLPGIGDDVNIRIETEAIYEEDLMF